MRVNAGSLDKRISIVQEVKEQDPDGYWSTKDRVVHACWAGFSRTSGKEILSQHDPYRGGQEESGDGSEASAGETLTAVREKTYTVVGISSLWFTSE